MDYNIITYILLGVLPSILWLFYYLSKDLHPEPKKMILSVFLWGALITVPLFFVQIGFEELFKIANTFLTITPLASDIIHWFLIIAFSEELFKYLVVKMKVISSPNLDEPLDIMLYMVVAALGFAAVENILYVLTTMGQMPLEKTLFIVVIRFLGAVFLHTLCSAVIGYSLAMSFCHVKKGSIYLLAGIAMATALHGLFNFSIITLHDDLRIIIPIIIILVLAVLTFIGFEKLKKMKSICLLTADLSKGDKIIK